MKKKTAQEAFNAAGLDTSKGQELIERKTVEGTPFEIIRIDEEGYFIAMGAHRLTEPTASMDELISKIENKDWELMRSFVGALIQAYNAYGALQLQKELQKASSIYHTVESEGAPTENTTTDFDQKTEPRIITDGKGPIEGSYKIGSYDEWVKTNEEENKKLNK